MIKAKLHTRDGLRLVLGITRTNIEEMLAGNPIGVDCAELGVHRLTISLYAGETRLDIVDQLERHGVVTKQEADTVRATDDGEGN